ncbi:MAG: hypothetical protein NTW84_03605 [Methanothrix sp.]|nr:hypothetical protein [Methanothrix sp.]
MSEDRQAAIVIGLVFLIGVAGLFLTGGLPGVKGFSESGFGLGDVYVDSYRADLYLNGTLAEQFIYQIKESGKYRMLYRNWEMTLSSQRENAPYVEPLEIVPPSGAIAYITDWRGNATLITPQSSQYKGNVQSLAEINEAGSYMPQRFPSGRYNVD